MLRAHHDDIRLFEQHRLGDVGCPIGAPQHAEQDIDVAGAQMIEQLLIGFLDDVHAGAARLGQKRVDRACETKGARRRQGADRDPRCDDALPGSDLVRPVIEFAHRELELAREFRPLFGCRDAPGAAVIDGAPQIPFELACGAMQRRLRHLNGPCRLIERHVLRDGNKAADMCGRDLSGQRVDIRSLA